LLTRKQKEILVEEFVKAFKESEIVVFTDFTGMTVDQSNSLRTELFNAYGDKCVYKVVRNSLLRTAINKAELNFEEFETYLEGSTGVFYVKEGDSIEGLKVLTEFAKKNKALPAIKGGLLEGQLFGSEKAKELAKLPSKPELIAMFLRGINAPISGFVNVLAGTLRSFYNVVNAIKDQKSE
jgi:large subunit ribosomal protein L10